MTIMVQLEGATRWFGSGHTEVVALHPTDLTVNVGELVAVMGPSGSGKTTLLSLVGGLDRPSGGRVTVAGQDVGKLDPRGLAVLRRRSVGYVFQDLNLLNGLTARENVSLPLELDGRPLATSPPNAMGNSSVVRGTISRVIASVATVKLPDTKTTVAGVRVVRTGGDGRAPAGFISASSALGVAGTPESMPRLTSWPLRGPERKRSRRCTWTDLVRRGFATNGSTTFPRSDSLSA